VLFTVPKDPNALIHCPDLKRSKAERQAPMGSIISTIYTFFRPFDDERADEPSDFSNVMAQTFLWILLAGFLVLPTTFTNVQKLVVCSNTLTEVVHAVRNVSAYVPSFPLSPLVQSKKTFPALYSF
jgi:hypothetical protein